MTENEAIEIIKNFPNWNLDDRWLDEGKMQELSGLVISALFEIQQYRSVGTVSECRRAVEKMKGKELLQLLFTWDRICDMAEGKPPSSPAVKAKDLARREAGILMVRNGEPVPEEAGLPEDAIKDFCDRYGVLFYWDGYVARVSREMQRQMPAMTR